MKLIYNIFREAVTVRNMKAVTANFFIFPAT